jgi:hypothetical protein
LARREEWRIDFREPDQEKTPVTSGKHMGKCACVMTTGSARVEKGQLQWTHTVFCLWAKYPEPHLLFPQRCRRQATISAMAVPRPLQKKTQTTSSGNESRLQRRPPHPRRSPSLPLEVLWHKRRPKVTNWQHRITRDHLEQSSARGKNTVSQT